MVCDKININLIIMMLYLIIMMWFISHTHLFSHWNHFPRQEQQGLACKNNLDCLFGSPNMLRQRQYKKQQQLDDTADIKRTYRPGHTTDFCPETTVNMSSYASRLKEHRSVRRQTTRHCTESIQRYRS